MSPPHFDPNSNYFEQVHGTLHRKRSAQRVRRRNKRRKRLLLIAAVLLATAAAIAGFALLGA